MTLDVETVRHYAKLANLAFSDAELGTLATQLGSVLQHVEKISELDLGTVLPTAQVHQAYAELRKDRIAPSLGSELALSNAPDKESYHFLVPKVIKVKSP